MLPTILTLEQLRQFDGQAGRRSYVAINGKIYDVSASDLWIEGNHQGSHGAGNNLTRDLANAPHGDDVLSVFPVVGELRK